MNPSDVLKPYETDVYGLSFTLKGQWIEESLWDTIVRLYVLYEKVKYQNYVNKMKTYFFLHRGY